MTSQPNPGAHSPGPGDAEPLHLRCATPIASLLPTIDAADRIIAQDRLLPALVALACGTTEGTVH